MRRTLLLIPHEIAGLPVFGFGWALIFLVLAIAVRAMIAKRSGRNVSDWLPAEAVVWGLFAIAIILVLPRIELQNIDGDPIGIAIRGYGMMLLLGVSSAVGLAWIRAKRSGLDPDVILNLAPWVFIGGLVGARLFYVVQYHDHFITDSFTETLSRMLTFTEGGLVVYGSFIGGFLSASWYIWRHKLPLLRLGDVIVPCMFLGLFFGRIGCLMNGCCYGGQCQDYWAALHFPPGSPVYQDQLLDGSLIGLDFDPQSGKVRSVTPMSLADQAGIQTNDIVQKIQIDDRYEKEFVKTLPSEQAPVGLVALVSEKVYQWRPEQLPRVAIPVQPAQLISSFSAIVFCLLLCAASQFIRTEGVIMLSGFAAYAILRFVLEWIRVDEKGQFGTNLSISQWVSLVVLVFTIVAFFWLFLFRKPIDLTGEE